MNRLCHLSFYTCLSLMVAILGARSAGQAASAPRGVARLHLVDCAPPCWIGIVPGLTTIQDAKAKIVAAFSSPSSLQIKDSGFADGYVSSQVVENAIEGDGFSVSVRLNISKLVDGKSEPVESIGLFESAIDNGNYAPTVADILGTFGPPQWVAVEGMSSRRYQITLVYTGLYIVFYTYSNQVQLTESPHMYFGNVATPSLPTDYRPWKGLGSLSPGK